MPGLTLTLARSFVVALGLMLGHLGWVMIGAAQTRRAIAWQHAYFESDARVVQPVIAGRPSLGSGAGSLWAASTTIWPQVAFSPVLLIGQLVAATLVTFAVWAGVLLAARCWAGRGVSGLRGALDLPPEARRAPPLIVLWLSPVFAFLAAVGLGFGGQCATRFAVWVPPRAWSFPAGQVGLLTPLLYAVLGGAVWAFRTVQQARRSQGADHRRGVACSQCGYALAGCASSRCSECGAVAPRPVAPVRKRRAHLSAALVLICAPLVGLLRSGAAPGVVERLLDGSFVPDTGFRINVPLRRPVLVEGDRGRLYLVAAPVETGETLVRAVVMTSPDRPARVSTIIIRAATPAGGLRDWLATPGIPTLSEEGMMASVYSRSFADTDTRFVIVDQLKEAPRRTTALPRSAQFPDAVREILEGSFPDRASAAAMLE